MSLGRWVAVVGILAATGARADIFSPGDLAKPHAELEGISRCTRCHPAGGQLSQERCLECHTELKSRVERGAGFHGRIPTDKRACESCHPEHRGRGFELIDWGPKGPKGFDHHRAGWPLEGGHAGLECDKCHERRRILSSAILKLLEQHPGRKTLLGVGKECKDCHFDDHRGQVDDGCGACHDAKAWKPAPGFDHAETDYPLRGKHKKVKCAACHPASRDEASKGAFPPPVSETFLKLAPIEFRACLDCHKDPHEAKFGPRCQSCHTVDGWSVIRNANAERAFHAKTKFPLKGEHLDVPCVSCHGPFPGQKAKFKGLPFEQCAQCHADAHLGQLKPPRGAKPADCEACHTVERFLPPRYSPEQHQKTAYPLDGAHQIVACSACHPRVAALADKVPKALRAELKKKKRPELFSLASFEFTKPADKCESCHEDVHAGQLKARPCAGCHQVVSFRKVKLDHARETRYPLTGKHADTPCAKCHGAPALDRPIQYRPLPMVCPACHEDVHLGQLASPSPGTAECERCHGTQTWKETKFLHQPPFTDYLLDGKHAEAKCEACHLKVRSGPAVETARYKPLPNQCEGCHVDFHQGAFKGFEP